MDQDSRPKASESAAASEPVSEPVVEPKARLNWKRLVNWLIYSVGFSLLPLLFTLFFRALVGKDALEANSDYPEVLFFSVVICATTVGEIRGINKPKRWDNYFFVLESLLVLGAVCSAVFYGGMRLAGIINPAMSFREQLLNYSLYSTITLFIFCAASQIMLATVEIRNE